MRCVVDFGAYEGTADHEVKIEVGFVEEILEELHSGRRITLRPCRNRDDALRRDVASETVFDADSGRAVGLLDVGELRIVAEAQPALKIACVRCAIWEKPHQQKRSEYEPTSVSHVFFKGNVDLSF